MTKAPKEPFENVRGHKLMPMEIRKKIPKLHSQEDVMDPLIIVRFFSPWSNWEWYALEFDGKDTFFGLVRGHVSELGYFTLTELANLNKNRLPLIERDIHFKSIRLSKVRGW